MSLAVAGSEKFASRLIGLDDLEKIARPHVPLHSVTQDQIDNIDPLTYEVVRHRLWSVTNEMGQALMRMSGSPIVTDANDFDFALSDELGQEVQVGLYNTMLVGSVDMAIYWTLQHRAANPGITEGDMFLCNDPWVGGGLHQNDAMVYQPVFWDGQLFGWTSAVAHQADLGGVGLGSFSPAAQDVFSEALPTPPIKVVRNFTLQNDVSDAWVRRSRVPQMVGLDLRAKVGANSVGRDQLLKIIEHYGPDTVKAVMKRMMNDAELRLRAKLSSMPNGTWKATGYQDQSGEGDRGLHGITVAVTKENDHLTFDFTGTDPQSGVINCTYAGMRGGIMLALLPHLAGDIPWSTGGLMRCFTILSEEGTINNATFPAAVGRAPVGPAWLTGNLVADCLSQMLDRSPHIDEGHVQATCCGTWDTAAMAGLDERSENPQPFLAAMMDPMAGGLGAKPDTDGLDTGGLLGIPMGRVPDVEMTEFMYPLLTLWRREEIDSGGPGRKRGGVSASLGITAHGTTLPMAVILASGGKAVSQNNGMAGGYPGNSGRDVIIRDAHVDELLRQGRLPSSLSDLTGTEEVQPCYRQTYLAPGEVLAMHWQGGGGYGDPTLRDPQAVLTDVANGHVSATAASNIYGVAIEHDQVDTVTTERLRESLRAERRSLMTSGQVTNHRKVSLDNAERLDDNFVRVTMDGQPPAVACRHCAAIAAEGDAAQLHLAVIRRDTSAAGPRVVSDAATYVDEPVEFRQYLCPGCATVVYSSVLPISAAAPTFPLPLSTTHVTV